MNNNRKFMIVFPVNNSRKRQDHLDGFRSEGRFCINIGCAVSFLGYNVYIVCHTFGKKKEIQNNVYIMNSPENLTYDIAMTFSHEKNLDSVKCNLGILMVHWPTVIKEQVEKINLKNILIACPYKGRMNTIRQITNLPTAYIPPVYPITTIKKSFFNYKSLPKKQSIKVYIFMNAHVECCEKDYNKVQMVIDKLSMLYENVELWIHLRDKNIPCIINNKKINFIYGMLSYNDLLDLFKKIDLAIIRIDAGGAGSCQYDIISMGLPTIPISITNKKTISNFVSPLYYEKDYLIYDNEDEVTTRDKLEHFFNNPKIIYNKFKDTMKDSELKNWNEIIKKQNIF